MKSRRRVIRKSGMTSNPESIKIYEASGRDPRRNLALERCLFESLSGKKLVLYLWQNDSTVVIGRNQNLRKECDLSAMEKSGILPVRRMSGGGAVYHDAGNLCFTFLARDDVYNEHRQLNVIRRALSYEGITSEFSGRNDLLHGGRKFSGNAYYHHGGYSYHHGTLMVDTDLSVLPVFLKPDPMKLRMKGVDSVRSRVMNLKEVCPSLTVEQLKKDLARACAEEYGIPPELCEWKEGEKLREYTAFFEDPVWIEGKVKPEDITYRRRFPWGTAELSCTVQNGTVQSARIDTDAMDPEWPEELAKRFTGMKYDADSWEKAVRETVKDPAVREDLAGWMKEQELIS